LSDDARIKTTSIIYYPATQAQVKNTIPVAEVAFAGDREISKVEISFDGGNTWNDATLKKSRSAYSWVLWPYEWIPANKGSATITVGYMTQLDTPEMQPPQNHFQTTPLVTTPSK
jgi:hypothetical protein